MSKEEARYLALMREYMQRFKEIRKDMERTQAEIARLKASSRRKLAPIDTILSRV